MLLILDDQLECCFCGRKYVFEFLCDCDVREEVKKLEETEEE